uniref:Aromatic-L-amino-acid decarboxylase n=1 Tax=Syphacia muris TaxID=451379 RepID=A0A0N5ASE7_9BILA
MNADEFRKYGKELVDFIADYVENVYKRRVIPEISPNYLRDLIQDTAPDKPESYDDVIKDVDNCILPGIANWQHPQFHGYFPAGNSFPAVMGEMLASAISTNSFSWASCPASTELETIVLDWLAKMIGLPNKFLNHNENGCGGGVIQTTSSECVFVTLLAARHAAIQKHKRIEPDAKETDILCKLTAYCSKEVAAHSSVEKAAKLGMVKLRQLDTDKNFKLRANILQEAIQSDIKQGYLPFFVVATLGTTSSCAFDPLDEIGQICKCYNIWFHVDAAYAGTATICPEFKFLLDGIEYASSFSTNPYKLLNATLDCSTLWIENRQMLINAFSVDPVYLTHNYGDKFKGGTIDYRHWGISLSRRFRALKLWFVIRMYGVSGLQQSIRKMSLQIHETHVALAKKFEELLQSDEIFEVTTEVVLGLVVFRVRGTNSINQLFLNRLNETGSIFMIPALLDNQFVIRFCVCSENATYETIQQSYKIIHETAVEMIGNKLTYFLA